MVAPDFEITRLPIAMSMACKPLAGSGGQA
jgi:hypothetical protein